MASLTVSLDAVAYARGTGGSREPDPAQAAVLAELGGADGILLQFRRDKKFVRERDLYQLKGIVSTKLMVEMPLNDDAVKLTMDLKPAMVFFVADHADSDTPVATINFANQPVSYDSIVNQLHGVGIRCGFFIDPESDELKGLMKTGADAAMVNTRGYAHSRTIEEAHRELDKIDKSLSTLSKASIETYCSVGLTYKNIVPLLDMDSIDEFIIGQSVCARAILVGMERAVREMKEILR